MTSAAHKPAVKVPAGRASGANPVVVYVASSLDGTSLALDPASRERIPLHVVGLDSAWLAEAGR